MGFLFLQKQWDPNFPLLCISFLALYGSTTIQSRLILKNIENFVWFPKQYLLRFYILEKQFANIPDRGFLFLHNTLLLYSLSPYRQTDRESNTLALCGLEEPFFQLCCCVVSVFGSGGKKVLIYIRMYHLEYNTVVVVC